MDEDNNVETNNAETNNAETNTQEVSNIIVGEHMGQVKWFNKKKGFGFIKNVNDPTSEDVFFHFSDIQSVGYKILYPGEFVSMDIGTSDRNKPICRNIRGIVGLPLLTDNAEYHFRVIPKRENSVSQ